MKEKYFFGHPDFNEVIFFYGLHADSFQMPKKRATQRAKMNEALKAIAHTCPNFPYNEPLMEAIGITGNVKDYSRRDVDNMAKTIFDALKGVVFEDDRLVHILLIQKEMRDHEKRFGFEVGIRPIEPTRPDKYTPILRYSCDDVKYIGERAKAIRFLNFSNEYLGDKVFRSPQGDILKVVDTGETWIIVEPESI